MGENFQEDMDLAAPTPTLTFEPFEEGPAETKKEEIKEKKPVWEESSLTPEEQKMVDQFAKQIQLSNSQMILQYGVGAQKKIADFSESALEKVKTKDLGEVGDMLTDLVTELKSFDQEEEEKGFFSRWTKKTSDKLDGMKNRYQSAEKNVNNIVTQLEGYQVQLMKDIAMLDKMYEFNKAYFKELSMYVLAGKKKLRGVESEDLPKLAEKAASSSLPEDAQAVNDLQALCNRFEKKLHDLELTRMISIQMAPQIRMVQNNDTLMTEKIQSTIVNTIPLWKSQMVLALGVAHSTQAAKAQREVTDMTNELLKRNAQTLKMATIETAKESERGIVDIDTLKKTNEALIQSIDEVFKIQQEGHQKRMEAEAELGRIENELKTKLLRMNKK